MARQKPVALWSVPRSLSTAFERIFVERDDFEVLHEPFSAAYYYGPDRLSDRYPEEELQPEYSYANVLREVLRPRQRRVFLKDMAYQARTVLDADLISRFANSFILRDPKYVIASLEKMWPDFTFEETGFEQIYWAFRYAMDAGEDPVVVDAMTFSENPTGVLATYCEKLGIPFDPGSLSWESREVEQWEMWDGWHDQVQQSTGIEPAERKDPVLSGRSLEAYEYCLPYYYPLAAHAIPGTAHRRGGTS